MAPGRRRRPQATPMMADDGETAAEAEREVGPDGS